MTLRVLIADDSEVMRNLLRERLQEDYEVVGEAENGVEAIELYSETDPVLFDEASALAVADAMPPSGGRDEFDSMAESALEGVGNVMTSGFIDGWANALGTSTAHTPPQYGHDLGTAVLDPVVNRTAVEQDHAFVVDTAMRIDGREFGRNVFTLPDGYRPTGALGATDVPRPDASG